jgi:hypothetical protein
LENQAKSIGLPLEIMQIPEMPSMKSMKAWCRLHWKNKIKA